jgi:hypothetical protein
MAAIDRRRMEPSLKLNRATVQLLGVSVKR